MASVSDIISELQGVLDELDDAVRAASSAASTTDEVRNQMAAADMHDKVAVLGSLKEAIDKLSAHISGGVDLANDTIAQARAISGGP